MDSWESTFSGWAQGPSQTEQKKYENAESAVRKAIAGDSRISAMDITVFAQGSYRCRTNVKQDSDVDICVRLNSTFFEDYPVGKTREAFGNSPGTITFHAYKDLVYGALNKYFGAPFVTRGDKAFTIHENTYRVDADVVAAFEHRWYTGQRYADGTHHYHAGIGFNCDSGKRITNWPQQTYDNGVKKHAETARRYKRVIRILKHLRNQMQDEKISGADDIASFLIESLIWNAPNTSFGHDSYTSDVRSVLVHTFNNTISDEKCKDWGEVNELKYLFWSGQPWTRLQAHAFLSAAWDYIGFE